jgi:hypothetical protein
MSSPQQLVNALRFVQKAMNALPVLDDISSSVALRQRHTELEAQGLPPAQHRPDGPDGREGNQPLAAGQERLGSHPSGTHSGG